MLLEHSFQTLLEDAMRDQKKFDNAMMGNPSSGADVTITAQLERGLIDSRKIRPDGALNLATEKPSAAKPPKQQFAGVDQNGTPVGGINLDPALLNLQIKRDGKGMPLPVNQQPILNMKIDGFVPVIINVTPVNLPMLMGFTEDKKKEQVELV